MAPLSAMDSGPSRLLLLPVDPPQPDPPDPDEAVHAEPAIVFPTPPPRALRTPRRSPLEPLARTLDESVSTEARFGVDFPSDAASAAEPTPLPVPLRQHVAAAVEPEAPDEVLPLPMEEAADRPPHERSQPAPTPLREVAARPLDAADSPESPAQRGPARRRRDSASQPPPVPLAEPMAKDPEGAERTEVHFGTLLRRARERNGLTLSDVADRTRISPRWIRALEDAQLDILPAPVFVSGYLRTYARLVGLDGQDLLARYQTLSRKRAQALAPTERGFKVRRHGQPVQVPAWLVAALLGGITTVVLGVLWLTNSLWRR